MFFFVKKVDLEQHSGNVENYEQYGIGVLFGVILMRLCAMYFVGEVLIG